MAEGFFKETISMDNRLKGRYCCSSAGILALDGDIASRNSILVLKNLWDINISDHVARRIDLEELKAAYLILTMTKGHKETILSIYPKYIEKVFTLKEFVEEKTEGICDMDIMDPYGMSLETYEICAKEIKEAVDKLTHKLQYYKI